MTLPCPACNAVDTQPFFDVQGVPVHSVQLVHTRADAVRFPRGDIRLFHCRSCDFIFNAAFETRFQDYGHNYESTQTCSATFRAFDEGLAQSLIDRYRLRRKRVVEIGCGQGEFLLTLCQLGDIDGVGFDPAYRGALSERAGRVCFVKDCFSAAYAQQVAGCDLLCCKMTLEHIPQVRRFIAEVRRVIDQRTIIFFQVPNMQRILREAAFWDVYYEHCSYFVASALARLFELCGFDVLETRLEYAEQYLVIEAKPGAGTRAAATDAAEFVADVDRFAASCREAIEKWRKRLHAWHGRGDRIVLWGAGSKAVAFCAAVGACEVACAVDVNPGKHGTFLPATGQAVVSPESLRACAPQHVILMNPVYRDEVLRALGEMQLQPALHCLGGEP
jgi:SAM-dependent methyltransferase